jgi:hypothetical protein
MPRKSDPKPAAASTTKPKPKPAGRPKAGTSASGTGGAKPQTRTPKMVQFMAEVYHGWMEHTELLGVIPISGKNRDDAYAQADALYHHNWRPFLPAGRRYDRELLEIRIRPLAEWNKRAATLLSKATVKLAAAQAAEAAKAKKPTRRRRAKATPKPVAKAS